MKLLHALAALPFFAAAASAHPVQLSDKQMDKINAGFLEITTSNQSLNVISLWRVASIRDETTPNFIKCDSCFLLISSPTFAVAAAFSPTASFSVPKE